MTLSPNALAQTPDLLAGLTDAPPREAAEALAALGLPVFPAHTFDHEGRCSCGRDCGRSAGKHPRTPRGLSDASTESGQIRNWWRRWPNSNVAVVTGSDAGIWVLDNDPGREGEAAIAHLEATVGDLPPTWCVETGGGGLHLWFRHPSELLRSSVGVLGPGIDVRANGGYVIVPPSRHHSGNLYRWADGWHPTRVDLALAPTWLFELAGRAFSPGMIPPERLPIGEGVGGNHLHSLQVVISEGQRNATLTSFAGSMRQRGFGEAAIHAALQAENADRCNPPLPEAEIARIARSVSRYAPAAAGVSPRRSSRAKTFVEFVNGKAVAR
jgi:putative DNA primase/helicase